MRVPKELEDVLSITNPYWLEFINSCKSIHDLREIILIGKNSTLSELDIGKAECCIVGEFHDGHSSYWDECAECHRLSLEFSAVIRPRSKLGKPSFIEKLSEFVQHIQLTHAKILRQKMACKLCRISDTPRYAVSA